MPGSKTAAQIKRQKEKDRRRNAKEMELIKAEHAAAGDPSVRRDAERAAMIALLEGQNLRMVELPADGDCLFTSFSQQLLHYFPNDEVQQASRLRKVAAEHILAHTEMFQPFVEEPLADYVKRLEGGTSWGGEVELTALCDAFGVSCRVLQAEGIEYTRIIGTGSRAQLTLVFLKHFAALGPHYNGVITS